MPSRPDRRRLHRYAFFLVGLFLAACNLPRNAMPRWLRSPSVEITLMPLETTPTPYEGCFYVWTSKALPELSEEVNRALQALGPEISGGGAYAYGEDCVFADGRREFHALETDFSVGINVEDIKDESILGDWIRKVMEVVLAFPSEALPGSQPGRVDFLFSEKDETGRLSLSVSIERYRHRAADLQGAELFRFFYNPP